MHSLLTLQDSGGVPSWVWNWLSNLIGSTKAYILQSCIIALVYIVAGAIIIWQIIAMIIAWKNYKHNDTKIHEEAKKRTRSGFIIIVAIVIIVGIGMSVVFFLLNTILSTSY